MALTGTDRGTGGNNTTATSVTISPNANFAYNSMGVICIGYDNAGSSGADPFSAISDSLGNLWTSRVNSLNDPGAASAGSVLRIFTSNMNHGPLTTGTVVTISFGAVSVVAKAITIMEINAASGFYPAFTTNGSATSTTTTSTVTTGTINIGEMTVGAFGGEGNSTKTPDSDTTNGTWSTAQQTAFGTTTSGVQVLSQRKVQTTANSTQTFNITLATASDGNIGYVVLRETRLNQAESYFIFLD